MNTIEEIIDDLRQGKMVIIMDDEDRENGPLWPWFNLFNLNQ